MSADASLDLGASPVSPVRASELTNVMIQIKFLESPSKLSDGRGQKNCKIFIRLSKWVGVSAAAAGSAAAVAIMARGARRRGRAGHHDRWAAAGAARDASLARAGGIGPGAAARCRTKNLALALRVCRYLYRSRPRPRVRPAGHATRPRRGRRYD